MTLRVSQWTFVLLLSVVSTVAVAQVFEQREFQNPQHEQRYRDLIDELRCLVCQNQNLADSNAPLAADLRGIVFDMIQNGKDNDEIRAFMVERYGDFVLYRPPFAVKNFALWVGPFALLVAGFWLLLRQLRRRALVASAPTELSEAEKTALAAMLEPKSEQSNHVPRD